MNSSWIDCGLVWAANDDYPSIPSFDHSSIDNQALVELGFCFCDDSYGEEAPNSDDIFDEREKALTKMGSSECDIFSEEVEDTMSKFPDEYPHWNVLKKIGQKRDKYWDWLEARPEYHKYLNDCKTIKSEFVGRSFCGQNLNRPGTIIELEDGTRHLIGSINTNRGICDDCTAFSRETIVKRYQVLIDITDLG